MYRVTGPREDGFVLITVAGILLLIAILATSAMLGARGQINARAALDGRAEASVLADGLSRLVAARLAEDRRSRNALDGAMRFDRQYRVDGSPIACRDGDAIAVVRVNDTAGLVDLNAAPQAAIEALITGLGVSSSEASRLAAAVIDFRDADDTPVIGGAEIEEYRAAGRAYGPKNSPFESVDELDQVLGMTPELVSRLVPLVTVHSQSNGIDPTVAPEELLRALAQDPADPRDQLRLPPSVTVRPSVSGRGSRDRLPVMVVRIVVSIPSGARFMREAVVELTSAAPAGFLVRHWTSRPAGSVSMPASGIDPIGL